MTDEKLKEFALIGILHRYNNEKNKLKHTTDKHQKQKILKCMCELEQNYKELENNIVKIL